MKHSKTTIILTILISIALFVVGFFSFGNINEALLPKVDNCYYQVAELGGQFKTLLVFAFILSLTPICIWATWRVAPIILNRHRVFSILTVVSCMTVAILVRQQSIRSYFSKLISFVGSTSGSLMLTYPIDKVHFEYYLLGGLCTGCMFHISFSDKKQYRSSAVQLTLGLALYGQKEDQPGS